MKLLSIKKRGGAHAKKTRMIDTELDNFVLDENSPFAMQEAYKALRTNVIFSIPGEECKVILVTSSIQGKPSPRRPSTWRWPLRRTAARRC